MLLLLCACRSSQVSSVQTPGFHACARNTATQTTGVPGSPALLHRCAVLVATSECTVCLNASFCFSANLIKFTSSSCRDLLQEANEGFFAQSPLEMHSHSYQLWQQAPFYISSGFSGFTLARFLPMSLC